MSDDDDNIIDLYPCDTEPPCESLPSEGYKLNHLQLPDPRKTPKPVDMVNSPPHYNQGKYELVDIIEHIVKDYPPVQAYHVATVIKYLGRAPYKGKLDEDMRKAYWHLRRAIKCKQE